jgi:hypothetical protein
MFGIRVQAFRKDYHQITGRINLPLHRNASTRPQNKKQLQATESNEGRGVFSADSHMC